MHRRNADRCGQVVDDNRSSIALQWPVQLWGSLAAHQRHGLLAVARRILVQLPPSESNWSQARFRAQARSFGAFHAERLAKLSSCVTKG